MDLTESALNDAVKKTFGARNVAFSDAKAIVFSPNRGKTERTDELKKLKEALPEYEYVADNRSGFLRGKRNSRVFKIFMKPDKSSMGGELLKPGFFPGVAGVWIDYNAYPSILLNSINNHTKLTDDQKDLLVSLVEYHISFSSVALSKFKAKYAEHKDTIPISTINNDFGEVLGPFGVVNKKLIKFASSRLEVFFPQRGNEPLLDYKITTNSRKKEYNISAKSGDTTNTLKPTDILNIINRSKILKTKYQNTHEYQVIKILTEKSTKEGPAFAVNYLKSKNFAKCKFLKDTKYSEEVRQKCENTLVDMSKKELNFTPMFLDVTDSKVYYVKFLLTASGEITWTLIDNKANRPKTDKRIVLRSKNYVGRAGDKLGLQPS